MGHSWPVPGSSGFPGPSRDVSARIVEAEVADPRARSDERRAEGGVMHPHVLERAIALVRHPLRHDDLTPARHERDDALDEQRRVRETDSELDLVAAVGVRGDRRSPRERARLAVVGVVDAAMARGPSARGEQDLPASCIRVEPRLRRALRRDCRRHACGAPRVSSRARRRPSGGPRLRGCPRLDRATASPGSGRRRARRHG